MKALTFLAVLFAMTLGAPAIANAYCCWNKAICVAVCGTPCCGSVGSLTTGQQENLGKVSSRKLQAEINQCKDAAAIQTALDSEIDRRKVETKHDLTR